MIHPRTKRVRSQTRAFLALLLALAFIPGPAHAQAPVSTILDRVGFDQKLGAQLPLDLALRDESGQSVPLGSFFNHGKPVLVVLVYFQCPMLCNQVLNGLTRGIKPMDLELNRDFDIVTVSIDPKDTPELAAHKKSSYLGLYGRSDGASGWHFLTGDPEPIERLAQAVGFRYTFNPATGQFAHAAGLVIATSDGRLARYSYGINFPPRDLQFSLMEASAGRIGSPIARVLLLCYDYDAATGKYTLAIMRLTQVLGIATVLALAFVVWMLRRRERRGHPVPAPCSEPIPVS